MRSSATFHREWGYLIGGRNLLRTFRIASIAAAASRLSSNGTNEAGVGSSEIDRAIAAGVRFGCVLADAGYGLSAPFRPNMTARRAISVHGARSSSTPIRPALFRLPFRPCCTRNGGR